MLRTRLIVGTILAALAAGMLLLDESYTPGFPFLFATVLLLAVGGAIELLGLLPPAKQPNRTLTICGVLLVVILNWARVARGGALKSHLVSPEVAWWAICQGFGAIVLLAFLLEMTRFT